MKQQQTEATPPAEAPHEVDRIRDIIFGSQMRDYEQRFQVFQRDLSRLQQELDHLSETITSNDAESGKRLQVLRQELRQADGDLRDELRQTAQGLMSDKVDRATLGDLLIELGNHLKTGGALSGLLEGLEKPE